MTTVGDWFKISTVQQRFNELEQRCLDKHIGDQIDQNFEEES